MILKMLPYSLAKLLTHELNCGNLILGISKCNWPEKGSIIVNFKNRFSKNINLYDDGIVIRILYDPHYCTEEMSDSRLPNKFLFIA